MSSLIFILSSEQVVVATDSLGTMKDGTPAIFGTKALYLPHLRLIVAGTGVGNFSTEWFGNVAMNFVTSGVDNLDLHAPEALRKQWAVWADRVSANLSPDVTTTVYHFGISEETGACVGYAYRSTNAFRSEALGYGIGCKPECDTSKFDFELASLEGMMREQRRLQEEKPLDERIHIGGECHTLVLTKEQLLSLTLFEFEDHMAVKKQVMELSPLLDS